MTEITLYSASTCPFAQRTRLLLLEKGLDYTLTEIDLKETPDWFHRISPYGKVPVLEYGDDRIWESAIINEYLEETFPDPPLLPSKPGERAYARFWIDFANVKFTPWFYKLLLEQQPEKRIQRATELAEQLLFVEHEAFGNPRAGRYWLGDRISLVDLAFYPFFERFPILRHYRNFALPEQCPRLADWWRHMSERDSVREIMNPPDFYIRSYTDYADGSVDGSTARDMRES
jgi:glutathione S-transferase